MRPRPRFCFRGCFTGVADYPHASRVRWTEACLVRLSVRPLQLWGRTPSSGPGSVRRLLPTLTALSKETVFSLLGWCPPQYLLVSDRIANPPRGPGVVWSAPGFLASFPLSGLELTPDL